ncbi:hypothetical protein P4O66_000099 [Electrophorus voltai]|uniref:RING-type domain-containing protein n=1 Tax=Electrophorus voltai TaxID=2609070 RepID=A0AAD8ZXR2_9TELE|nr:hypothetical protein P4O66_000099 [Electrophorus voltai]
MKGMGYDLERFVGYVNEGLLCCVCRAVLEDPLQAPCEHAFCSSCIHAWLLHRSTCPEDRLPLDVAALRPLHRYPCTRLSTGHIPCTGGYLRRDPSVHEYPPTGPFHRNRLLTKKQAELDCKVEEVRHEMESRLDSQRRHMVQKESLLKSEVDDLKGQLSRMMSDVRVLLGAERARKQELERAELEKAELLELLKKEGLRPTPPTPTATPPAEGPRKPNPRSSALDCIKRKTNEVALI